jgi:hypothetical protein
MTPPFNSRVRVCVTKSSEWPLTEKLLFESILKSHIDSISVLIKRILDSYEAPATVSILTELVRLQRRRFTHPETFRRAHIVRPRNSSHIQLRRTSHDATQPVRKWRDCPSGNTPYSAIIGREKTATRGKLLRVLQSHSVTISTIVSISGRQHTSQRATVSYSNGAYPFTICRLVFDQRILGYFLMTYSSAVLEVNLVPSYVDDSKVREP